MFASLLRKSKSKHWGNKDKWFLLHFDSSFYSWDNQILTFEISVCDDIIKSPSMNTKHKTLYANEIYVSLCNITTEKFCEKILWKLWPWNYY